MTRSVRRSRARRGWLRPRRLVRRLRHGGRGYTLIELVFIVAIIATMSAIALPMYNGYLEKARVARAIAEIRSIEKSIDIYGMTSGVLPESLAEVDWDQQLDPWGNPYEYLKLGTTSKYAATGHQIHAAVSHRRATSVSRRGSGWTWLVPSAHAKPGGGKGGGKGGGGGPKPKPRKDRFLHPINSDYDLYSKGKDGDSVAPLTAKKSHDDVIRANDGVFVGLAVNF